MCMCVFCFSSQLQGVQAKALEQVAASTEAKVNILLYAFQKYRLYANKLIFVCRCQTVSALGERYSSAYTELVEDITQMLASKVSSDPWL